MHATNIPLLYTNKSLITERFGDMGRKKKGRKNAPCTSAAEYLTDSACVVVCIKHMSGHSFLVRYRNASSVMHIVN